MRALTTSSLVALLCTSTVAFAQARQISGFDLEQLTLNPAQRHGLVMGSADLLDRRQLRAAFTLHYQHLPLILVEDGAIQGAVVRSRVTAHLSAAFGITRWLEVGLQLPLVIYQSGDTLEQVVRPTATALGTGWLQGRVAFLSQARGYPLDVGLLLALGVPLGGGSALASDETASFSPRLQAGRALGLIRIGAELGAIVRKSSTLSPGSPAGSDEVGSSLALGIGATTTNEGLRGEVTVLGRVPFTHAPASMELLFGARYAFGPVEIFALLGPGLGRTPGTPAFRALLGAGLTWPKGGCVEGTTYEPQDCPKLDLDQDGVLNESDLCPRVVGVESRKGCPVPDTDKDGIDDDHDACPKVKGLASLHGCPDGDGDGVADPDDKCPAVPGAKENAGCPWPDSDEDGLVDPDDKCPTTAGPRENAGCPWPDTDSDGLIDAIDKCPKEAGPKENAGCPWLDTDGDTVIDTLDNCPKEKGDPANQGCPKAKKQLVVITREQLVIKDKVYFETGKATLLAKSSLLLGQIADVMREHPELTKVSIEGHTDSTGKAEFNRTLSQKRAESVKEFLVKKGIDPFRLDAKGFGPDQPAALNATAAGREKNRRVEFVIIRPENEAPQLHEVTP